MNCPCSSVASMDDASLRASDADREQAVAALREHLLAGRLTLEEFSERVDGALRARVTGEPAHLQNDLPEVFPEPAGSRRKPVRFTTAFLGHVVRNPGSPECRPPQRVTGRYDRFLLCRGRVIRGGTATEPVSVTGGPWTPGGPNLAVSQVHSLTAPRCVLASSSLLL